MYYKIQEIKQKGKIELQLVKQKKCILSLNISSCGHLCLRTLSELRNKTFFFLGKKQPVKFPCESHAISVTCTHCICALYELVFLELF